jgi:hypothetical protein
VTNIADPEWANQQLDRFLELTELVPFPSGRGKGHAGGKDELIAQAVIVERILVHLDPAWRDQLQSSMNPDQAWNGHRTLAIRAKATIAFDAEISDKLGDNAPQIRASSLHPWAWDGARSLWQSRHYREAVTAAARKVNAEAQNKVMHRSLSEVKLFQDALSVNPPAPGRPRLRIVPDDGSVTFASIQRGVMAFAEGCFSAIRNPNSGYDGLIWPRSGGLIWPRPGWGRVTESLCRLEVAPPGGLRAGASWCCAASGGSGGGHEG